MNFYDIEAEFYDLFYFDFVDDIKFYKMHTMSCDRVLEFMCGTGRILHHLNPKEGWGVDINDKMLKRARENLRGRNVRLIKGDVREIDLGERFCTIIIGMNSLLMFPSEDRIKILKNAARHLRSGGKILIDVMNPFGIVEGIMHHGATVKTEIGYISRFYVPLWKKDHWEMIYFFDVVEDDILKRRIAKLSLYFMDFDDLKRELEEAGFEISHIYGDYQLSPYTDESERILVVGKIKKDRYAIENGADAR